jgi:fibronectin-binding autotransporter adhesin
MIRKRFSAPAGTNSNGPLACVFEQPANGRATFQFSRAALLATILVVLMTRPSPSKAANGTWTSSTSGGSWSNPANWSGGTIADGTGSIADFSTLNITADETVHLDSARTVGTLKFGDTVASNNWVLDNNGDPADVLTLATSSGTPTIQVTNQSATISAILAGNQGLQTSGSLTLTGANIYSGPTAIFNVLTITSDAALGAIPSPATPDISLASNGTLRFATDMTLNSNRSLSATNNGSTLDTQSFNVIYGGKISGTSGLTKTGSGTLTLAGTNVLSGPLTVSAGTLQLAGSGTLGANTVSLALNGGIVDLNGTNQLIGALNGTSGSVVNNASTTGVTFTIGNGGATGSYAGHIADHLTGTGTLSLVKIGSGTETLTGTNTYTGGTVITAGTLAVNGNTGSLANASPLSIGATATFLYQGKSTGGTQGLGQLVFAGGDGLVQSTYGTSGNTSLQFSSMLRSLGATGTFAVSGGTNGTTNTIVVSGLPANSFVDPGVFSSSGGTTYAWNDAAGFIRPIKYGSDVGAVSSSGGTAVFGSYVQTTGAILAEPTSTFVSLNIVGATDFSLADGAALTVSSLLKTGNNTASLHGGAAIEPPLNGELIVRDDATSDVLNLNTPLVSNGNNQLSLAGAGKLLLSSANPFGGTIAVSRGTLQLGNTNAAMNSTLAINAANGLKFSAGIGNLTVGALTGGSGISLTDVNGSAVTLQIGNNSTTVTYGGSLTGSGSLVKIGSGVTALAGANTFTGGVTLNGGTLQVTGQGTFGGTSGKVNVLSGLLDLNGTNQMVGALNGTGGFVANNQSATQFTLTLSAPNAFATYSGTIADHTSGSGTLALSLATAGLFEDLRGTNTYSGGTAITNSATLGINSDAALGTLPQSPAPNLIFGTGTLSFDSDFAGGLSSNRSIVTNVEARLSLPQSMSMSYAGTISGSGGLTVLGQGTLRLTGTSSFSGTAKVGGGALVLDGNGGQFAAGVPVSLGSAAAFTYQGNASGSTQNLGVLSITGADAVVQSSYGQSGNTSLNFSSISRSAGSTATFIVSGGTIGVTNSIRLTSATPDTFVDPGIYVSTASGLAYAWNDAGGFVRPIDYLNDPGAITSSGASSVVGNYVQITGQITAQPTTVLTSLQLVGGSGMHLAPGATLTVSGILKTGGSSATVDGGAGIQLPVNGELIIRADGATDNLTLNCPILGNGVNPLTIDGGGTVVLGTPNTFSGVTVVTGGTLQLNDGLAVQNSTLQFGRGARLAFGSGVGTVTVNSLSGLNGLNLTDTGGGPVNLKLGANNGNMSLSGVSGAGGLIKVGPGTLTLGSTNTYSGITQIDGGVIAVSTLADVGSTSEIGLGSMPGTAADLVFGGGTLRYSGLSAAATNRLFTIGDATGNAAIIDSSGGGPIAFTSTGPIALVNAAPHTLTLTGTNAGVNTFAPSLGDQSGGNPTSLSIRGAGTWIMSGANTYSGGTTIATTGMVRLSGSGTLGSAMADLLLNASTLDLNGVNLAVGALNGSGSSGIGIINNASGTLVTLTVGNGDGSGAYSGQIGDHSTGTGALALKKVGSGIFTLSDVSNPNTFSGGTYIDGGILNINLVGADTLLGTPPATPQINITFSRTGTLRFTGGALNPNRLIDIEGGATATLDTENYQQTSVSMTVYNGTISGAGGFAKQGLGTLTLGGQNTFTGGTLVQNGALIVSGSLANASPLSIGNGALFSYVSPSAGGTQALGTLTLTGGDATIQSTYGSMGVTNLSFAGIASRPDGATADFVTSGGSNGTTNKISLTGAAANSFVDPGVFFGTGSGLNFAFNDAAGFLRAINYGSDAGSVKNPGGSSVAGTYVQTTGPISAETSATLKTLNISGASNFTLVNNAVVAVSSVLKSGTGAAAIRGGTGIQTVPNGDLILRTGQASDTLSLSTPIIANGTNVVAIGGPGTVALNTANTYSGGTIISGGTVLLGEPGALGDLAAPLTVQGGLVDFRGTNQGIGGLLGLGKVIVFPDYLSLYSSYGTITNTNTDFLSTLTVGNGNASGNYTGVITGRVGIVKVGSGTQILTGTSTFSGGTIVNGGVLVGGIGAPGSSLEINGTLTVNAGTLDVNGSGVFVASLAGSGGTIVNNASGTAATLHIKNAVGTGVYAGVIADHTQGTGTLALDINGFSETLLSPNTYSGGTSVLNGTLTIFSDAALGAVPATPTSNISLGNASVRFGADFVSTPLNANRIIDIGSGGTLDTQAFNVVFAGTLGGLNTATFTKTGAGTLTLRGAMFYHTTDVDGGTLVIDGNTATISGLGNFNPPLSYSNTGTFVYQGKSTGSTLAASSLNLAAGDATVQVTYGNSGNTSLAFAGLSRSSGGTGKFIVSGGANGSTNKITLAGVTTNSLLNQGTFFATASGTTYAWYDAAGFVRGINYASDPGAATFSGGPTISGTYVQTTGAVTSQASTVLTTLQINATTAAAGAVSLASGSTLTVNSILKTGSGGPSAASVISGGVGIQAGSNAELIVRADQSADEIDLATPILANGSNPVTLSGAGTIVFASPNSYTGNTSVNAALLRLVGPATLGASGTGLEVSNGAVLDLNGTSQVVSALSGTGSITNTAAGSPSTLTIGSGNAAGTYSGTIGEIAGSGTLAVVKTGTGQVILSGINSFTGGLTINSGIVKFASLDGPTLSASCPITINQNGELDLAQTNTMMDSPITVNGGIVNVIAGGSQHLNLVSLSRATVETTTVAYAGDAQANYVLDSTVVNVGGTGHSTLSGGVGIELAGHPTFIVASTADSAGDLIVSADLCNVPGGTQSGGFTKAGPGKMILSGGESYSGATVVSAGTLTLVTTTTNNLSASQIIDIAVGATLDVTEVSGAGGFAIAAGQRLEGRGSILGATLVANGGRLDPGESIGTLTMSSLNLDVGGILDYEINSAGASDFVNVTVSNGLTLNGGTVNLLQDGTDAPFAAAGTYHVLHYNGAIQGIGIPTLSVRDPQPGFDYQFSNNLALHDIDLKITAVPEPSTLILSMGGILMLAMSLRRRSPRG